MGVRWLYSVVGFKRPCTVLSSRRPAGTTNHHITIGHDIDQKEGRMAKRTKIKAQRGLVTHRIIYTSGKNPRIRNQEITVDVRRGTVIDTDHARGLVAVRTPLPLEEVRIVRIEPC